MKYSLVVPVYCNEASITDLIAAVDRLDRALNHALEVVFVVDGSPDRSYERLDAALPASGLVGGQGLRGCYYTASGAGTAMPPCRWPEAAIFLDKGGRFRV